MASRTNQRHRTRKDLLVAGARLLKRGQQPTMAELADEARVSRATVYRYFSSIDAVLCEAPIDDVVPDPADVFRDVTSVDPAERVILAEAALHDAVFRHADQLRAMLAHTLKQSLSAHAGDTPLRQNRRTPLIEAALEPVRNRLDEERYQRLCAALALVFGTESMIVLSDVLQLDDIQAREVKQWALGALVNAALTEVPAEPPNGAPAKSRPRPRRKKP